ncbi:MAG: sulfite exporter TauE/SafE family protein [Acidobacteriia bacterium]|nr:sulfite exporter TauE/SafE family protein [Terriglobia bacterium]
MLIPFLGFITGILIGLTGAGGGVILTPLLMLFTPYSAVVIIGTDIVNGAVTRLLGVIEHRRLGNVQARLAQWLILGSVPGTLGGVLLVRVLKTHLAAGQLDHVLKSALAVLLVGGGFILPWIRTKSNAARPAPPRLERTSERLRLAVVGAAVGFLVALTSVGSGSLLMIFLLLFIPLPLAALVGTDLLFGLVTLALAGSLHMALGHFSAKLFVQLVVGSSLGVVLGSRLTTRIPERYFSWLFSILYFSLGARLLVG